MKAIVVVGLLLWTVMAQAELPFKVKVSSTQRQFVIALAANPTTGYEWKLVNYDRSLLHLISSRYVAPSTKLIGAGGKAQFTFSLVKGIHLPTDSILSFRYQRPWLPNKGELKTVTINFINGDLIKQ